MKKNRKEAIANLRKELITSFDKYVSEGGVCCEAISIVTSIGINALPLKCVLPQTFNWMEKFYTKKLLRTDYCDNDEVYIVLRLIDLNYWQGRTATSHIDLSKAIEVYTDMACALDKGIGYHVSLWKAYRNNERIAKSKLIAERSNWEKPISEITRMTKFSPITLWKGFDFQLAEELNKNIP